MKIAIIYATREGQTRKIAEHVAAALQARAIDADLVDARDVDEDFTLGPYDGALLAASVHLGKHEKELVELVQRRREALAALPTAFLSVSGSEAAAERVSTTPAARTQAAIEVQRVIDRFFSDTRWQPTRYHPVAGAVFFSKYNFLLRIVMRMIARRNGGDTSGDHEYTDWDALDDFVQSFVVLVSLRRDDAAQRVVARVGDEDRSVGHAGDGVR